MDDILATSPTSKGICDILKKASEKTKLKIKEIGIPTDFLGLEVNIEKGKAIRLSLQKYTEKALK